MDKSETISKLRELNRQKYEARKKYDITLTELSNEHRKRTDDENNGYALVKRNHKAVLDSINDDISLRCRQAKSEYSDELNRIDGEMTQIRIAYFREHPDDNLM